MKVDGLIANTLNDIIWMLIDKLKDKDDDKSYYIINKYEKEVLESYMENGYEYVDPNGIKQ